MICIEKMGLQHTDQVAQLEAVCFHAPWSLRSIQGELDNPLSCWLVATEKERVVGYIGSQSVMGESDMMNVAVDPDFRCMGIGQMLISRLIEELKASGNYCLSLEVRTSNAPAIGLYHKLGFVQVGRRPNYYSNPKEDAYILRKEW